MPRPDTEPTARGSRGEPGVVAAPGVAAACGEPVPAGSGARQRAWSRRELLGCALGAGLAAVPARFGAPAGDGSGTPGVGRPRRRPDAATGAGGSGSSPPGTVLRVGTTLVSQTLDPLDGATGSAVRAVFDTLTTIAPGSYAVAPLLARGWQRPDPTALEVVLDPRATFADGSAVTAADVVFSLEGARAGSGALAELLAGVAAVGAPGPGSVRVVTAAPDPLLERRLAAAPVLGRAAYTGGAPGTPPALLGSGRYVVSGFRPGASLALSASSRSWLGPPATAHLGVVEAVTEDELAAAFSDGRIDVAQDLPAAALAGLAGRDAVALAPTGVVSVLVLRSVSGLFASLEARRAVAAALDVPALAAGVLGGAASPLGGQLAAPGIAGHVAGLAAAAHDPAEARRMLGAGARGAGVETVLAGLASQAPLLDAIAGQLAQGGIRARVVTLDTLAWTAAQDRGHDWPLFLAELDLAPLFDAGTAYGALTGRGRRGFAGSVDSPELVALDAAQSVELDASRRAALLASLAALVSRQVLFVPLVARQWLVGRRPLVGGVSSLGTELVLSDLVLRAG